MEILDKINLGIFNGTLFWQFGYDVKRPRKL